jgi:hypothetical protein
MIGIFNPLQNVDKNTFNLYQLYNASRTLDYVVSDENSSLLIDMTTSMSLNYYNYTRVNGTASINSYAELNYPVDQNSALGHTYYIDNTTQQLVTIDITSGNGITTIIRSIIFGINNAMVRTLYYTIKVKGTYSDSRLTTYNTAYYFGNSILDGTNIKIRNASRVVKIYEDYTYLTIALGQLAPVINGELELHYRALVTLNTSESDVAKYIWDIGSNTTNEGVSLYYSNTISYQSVDVKLGYYIMAVLVVGLVFITYILKLNRVPIIYGMPLLSAIKASCPQYTADCGYVSSSNPQIRFIKEEKNKHIVIMLGHENLNTYHNNVVKEDVPLITED